jgi:hypothetical protein
MVNNFFDAMGTVRMEAFVERSTRFEYPDELEEVERLGGIAAAKRRRGLRQDRRKRESGGGWSARGAEEWYGVTSGGGSRTDGEELVGGMGSNVGGVGWGREDPFRGF